MLHLHSLLSQSLIIKDDILYYECIIIVMMFYASVFNRHAALSACLNNATQIHNNKK